MVRMGSPVPIPVEGSTRTVLASARSTARPARFQPLLDGLELVGVVVTSDALQTPPRGRRVAGDHKAGPRPVQLQRQGQPAHTAGPLRRLPWQRVLMADRTRDRGHGRVELRTLKAVSVRHFGFPHAAQVRTGAAPTVMAVLRNLVVGVLSRAGPLNVAAALRRHARDPYRPLATLGISLG